MRIMATWHDDSGDINMIHYKCGGNVYATHDTNGGKFLICNECQVNNAFNQFGQIILQTINVPVPTIQEHTRNKIVH